jgi:hypothetical protein
VLVAASNIPTVLVATEEELVTAEETSVLETGIEVG